MSAHHLIQVALATLLLAPAISLLQSKYGQPICLIVIGALVAFKCAYEIRQFTDFPNYYSLLEVSRHSSAVEIRQSFKKLSLKLHPDKNPSNEAENKFQTLKAAYDILMDEKTRDIYNRYGSGVSTDPRLDELKLIGDISLKYLLWGLLAYLVTSNPGTRMCRTWVMLTLLCMLAVEVAFSLTESSIPSWLPGNFTEYELIFALHGIFPGVLLAFRSAVERMYVDINRVTADVLNHLLSHQESLHSLIDEIENMGDTDIAPQDSLEQIQAKIALAKNRINDADERANAALDTLKKSNPTPGSNYYWLIFVAIYGGVYFFQE